MSAGIACIFERNVKIAKAKARRRTDADVAVSIYSRDASDLLKVCLNSCNAFLLQIPDTPQLAGAFHLFEACLCDRAC